MALIMATGILGVDHLPSNLSDTLLTLTGFCAFAGKWGCSLVETSWFIGLIMSLYLVYPYLSRWMTRRPYGVICVLFVVSVLATLIIRQYQLLPQSPQVQQAPLAWFPLCRIFEFGLGIFLVKQDWFRNLMEQGTFTTVGPLFRYTSEISFPVFLIHYPLLSVIKYWRSLGGPLFGVAVYCALTLLLAHIILVLDCRLQRNLKRRVDAHRE